MSESNHQRAREFLADLEAGQFREGLFADDAAFWTLTNGAAEKERFAGGVKVLQSLFPKGLRYDVEAVTTEADRIIIEAKSHGMLVDGQEFQNVNVFSLRLRGDRICAVKEYMNPEPVRTKIIPLLQAAMAKKG